MSVRKVYSVNVHTYPEPEDFVPKVPLSQQPYSRSFVVFSGSKVFSEAVYRALKRVFEELSISAVVSISFEL